VPLRCQQKLHTQEILNVSTGKNPEDSNLAGMEAMQWLFLYLSIDHDISHSTEHHHACTTFVICQWHIL
jgi:hypothetical protein